MPIVLFDQKEKIQNLIRHRRIEFRQRPKRRLRKPPVWLYPRSVESSYRRELFEIIKIEKALTEEILFTHLPGLIDDANIVVPESSRQDTWATDVTKLMVLLREGLKIRTREEKAIAIDIGQRTSDWNDRQWRKTLKKVMGVDLLAREPWITTELESFTEENVALIKSIKDESVRNIEGMVQRGIREGKRHETIKKEILQQFNTTKKRAKLIARDQVAKLNGQLTRLRQTSIGLSRYIWHDSGDRRVRASHRENNGRLMSWTNSSIYYPTPDSKPVSRSGVQLHPGQDIQCRCWPEGYFEDVAGDFILI